MIEQYNTIEWNVRRLEILVRDEFKCVNCNTNKNLQVHHRMYDNKLKAWEYPDEYLITVCNTCHTEFHAKTPIATMYGKVKKESIDKKLVEMFKPKYIRPKNEDRKLY